MVRIDKSDDKADAVTSRYFMSSIKSWYNQEGILIGVEKVSKMYKQKHSNDKKKRGISVTFSVLDEMPKCRSRVIGEDGKPVRVEDETTGEERDEIAIISDPDEVTFFYNVRLVDEEKGEFSVNPKSSCFPLFNFAFQATGDLPEGNDQGFIASVDELKASLQGVEFKAKVKEESFSGGKPYMVLIPSAVTEGESVE